MRVQPGKLLENFAQDTRFGLRMLLRTPGFTLVAVLTIALGVGVNAAIFSIFDSIVLRPVPLPGAQQVVSVYQQLRGNFNRNFHNGTELVSYSEYLDYRDHSGVFSGLAAYMPEFSAMLDRDAAEVSGQLASCNYFEVLRAPLLMGRGFSPADCAAEDSGAVVVLNYEFWQERFAGDAAILGKTIRINRFPVSVVGVAAQGFHGTEIVKPSFWAPVTMQRSLMGRGEEASFLAQDNLSWLAIVGRLRSGITPAQARAALNVLAEVRDQRTPGRQSSIVVGPVSFFGSSDKHAAVVAAGSVVLVAVGLVLLIACANVANLSLARGVSRARETAIRLAMGASRGRVVRQLLTESVLIAVAGGAVGTVLGLWSAIAIARLALKAPGSTPLNIVILPSVRIFAYALALTLLTGLAFGLAPALQTTRPDVNRALKRDDSDPARSGNRLRNLLVGVQVAVCMVLLMAAGLLLRGLYHAQTVDPGYEMSGVTTLSFDLQREGYTLARAHAFQRDLLDAVRTLPGVDAVAEGSAAPLASHHHFAPFQRPGAGQVVAELDQVSSGFFATVGLPLIRGRDFTAAEAAAGARVIILNESAARLFWPGVDPIGKQLHGYENHDYDVIGVVRDAEYGELGNAHKPYVFLPAAPADSLNVATLMVHSTAAYPVVASALRNAALSLDRDLHITVSPLRDNLRPIVQGTAVLAGISGVLGAMALALAAIGIYGTVAFLVARRTREIGVRIAIGAQPADVAGLMVRQAMRPVVIGSIAGIAACTVVSRILVHVLFGVSSLDAVAFAGVPCLLALVALVASYLPARRAIHVDPMVALRHE
ncbi:MAG: ABC transporter permease [Acidobacteria bacterium]|nr:ABC transporter permease [Acidobacteriota bacterium]